MAATAYVGGDPAKVDIDGDTMTGHLVLPGVPTLPLHAATKAYVDAATGGEGAVVSVNGETGAVTLSAADVGASPTGHTHAVSDTTGLQAALDAKAAAVHTHAGADIASGTVAFARLPVGATSTTVAQGDHTHAGGGGAELIRAYSVSTSGNVSAVNSEWRAIGGDITLTGVAAGDVVRVDINGMCRGDTGDAVAFDVATRVSAANLNWFRSSGTPGSGAPGSYGGWYVDAGIWAGPTGPGFYVVQAGDISGGAVVLRCHVTNHGGNAREIRQNSTFPFAWCAERWLEA